MNIKENANKEVANIKEFVQKFKADMQKRAENNETDFNTEIIEYYLECMEECGEVNAPDVCVFSEGKSKLSAYDYNDETESIDLFLFVHTEDMASRVDSRVQTGFNSLQAFYDQCTKKKKPFNGAEKEFSGEVQDAINIVRESKGKVKFIRYYLLTDGVVSSEAKYAARDEDEEGVLYEYNIWDIASIYRQDQIKNGRDKIEIDFENDVKYYVQNKNSARNELVAPKIQCLKVDEENPDIDNYVAIISGDVLAKVYNQFRTLLLEKNVRAFLRNKSKVNQNIMRTIEKSPQKFFSYNNGISTTASSVELKPVGRTLYLTKLTDWQIVNGGQTTASIASASTKGGCDLSKVFVQMKICVVKDKEEYDGIVKDISTCANSQTGIKQSDFDSGEEYLVKMEKLGKEEIAPITNTKWFFERMRGQYTDTKESLGKYEAKNFKEEYPKSQVLTKLDVAKLVTIWNMRPYVACNSREKCFSSYMSSLKKEDVIDAAYWHKVVALAILYKKTSECADKRCGQNGFRTRTAAYAMSALAYITNQKLDLVYIWKNQKVQSQLEDIIDRIVVKVNNFLEQDNSRTFVKNSRCWDELKSEVENFVIPASLLISEDNEENHNEEETGIIAQANAITADCWRAMLEWAITENQLALLERRNLKSYIKRMESHRLIKTVNQAEKAIALKEKAEKLGFVVCANGEELTL